MAFSFNEQGISLYGIITSIGVLLLATSLSINIYDPTARLGELRDQERYETVKTLIAASERYTTVKKESPNCDRLDKCPTNITIDQSDEFSNALTREAFIEEVPLAPTIPSDDLCKYQAYLYPSSANRYFVRWCYETWTEERIEQLTAETNSYNCTWAREKSVALCFAGPGYEIPAP